MSLHPRRALVIAPHADDAEFGIGGLIQRLTAQACQVKVVIMARGGYTRSDGQKISYKERQQEACRALALLGVSNVEFAGAFAENEGYETPYVEIMAPISRNLADFAPTDVYVNLPSFNQDHRIVYDAFKTCVRPGVWSGERLWAYMYPGNSVEEIPAWGPVYVQLTAAQMARKIEALDMHESQFKGREHLHVGPAGAKALARMMGSECGACFAEKVFLMRGFFE
jgi:LmbE family N-acetylglucosaminyl deacetylase